MTAQAVPVNVTGTSAVSAVPCTYRGLSIRDTSGATNTVKVFDNTSAATGTVMASFQLLANASALDNVTDGVRAAAGLYLQSTGAIEGSVRVG
jgi:hypothetical protein